MVTIGKHSIGPQKNIFFIAEIGINHNQNLALAHQLIDVAADAGCDAAKFQTFRAQDLYVHRRLAGKYRLMGRKIPIYDLHVGLEMPRSWITELQAHCTARNIIFFSTPVAKHSVDLLASEHVPAFKISSYDFTNIPLITYAARKKKPMILSTGGATLTEVCRTVDALIVARAEFALLQCIAKYPAPMHCANLDVMDSFRRAFHVPIGFSDNGFVHTNGSLDTLEIPRAAARLGADLFEIHITLDRNLPGPDHAFATTPAELKRMVYVMRKERRLFNIRKQQPVSKLLRGSSIKRTLPEEEYVRRFAYKGLYATQFIHRGDRFSEHNTAALRPGNHRRGLDPWTQTLVYGARASRSLKAWEPLQWHHLLNQ